MKWTRRASIGLLMIANGCIFFSSREVSHEWRPGTALHEVSSGGVRSFLVHIPPGESSALSHLRFGRFERRYPLVVVLHGSGASGEDVEAQSGFDRIADQHQFVAVFPDASGGFHGMGSDWNAGGCCGSPAQLGIDDVSFIRAVIAEVEANFPINRRRIYVAGFSAGARMAMHYACASAGEVAAIGVVAGSLIDAHCAPARPVPVIAFHGTSDQSVPYDEPSSTPGKFDRDSRFTDFTPSLRFWADRNGCLSPTRSAVTTHVTRLAFTSCTGAETVLYRTESGTHMWPTSRPDADDADSIAEIDGSELMIRFFLKHRLRKPAKEKAPQQE